MVDEDVLRALNVEIGEREAAGDMKYFAALLAPAFAMRRASGETNDVGQFLRKVSESPRRTTEIDSITAFGDNRAVVTCTVAMGIGRDEKRFHNVRLFIRGESPDVPWLLLAWANETVA